MNKDSVFNIIMGKEDFIRFGKGKVFDKPIKYKRIKILLGLLPAHLRYYTLEYLPLKGTAKVLVPKGTKFIFVPWGIRAESFILLNYND
jgi:hypothetical protein